jgi:hypothetical protein
MLVPLPSHSRELESAPTKGCSKNYHQTRFFVLGVEGSAQNSYVLGMVGMSGGGGGGGLHSWSVCHPPSTPPENNFWNSLNALFTRYAKLRLPISLEINSAP